MNIIVAIFLLGAIIIIHELGHFLLAKKNGITVTEFSVGMGPRLLSVKKNETRYSLKLLPLGGSCMMLGEDETVEDEGAFHKKGVWARFSVIFGGAFFNFILAFLLAIVVIFTIGVDSPYLTKVEEGTAAYEAGLREGDTIKRIDGRRIHFAKEVSPYFFFHPLSQEAVEITYERDGKNYTISAIPDQSSNLMLGFSYGTEMETAEILEVMKGGPLEEVGIEAGDVIINLNGNEIRNNDDLIEYLKKTPLTEESMSLKVLRKDRTIDVTVSPKIITSYSLGLNVNRQYEKVSPIQTIVNSAYEVRYNVRYALDSLGYLISGKASVKEISGPVGIVSVVGQIVDETQDYGIKAVLINLASFCILISANLGVMNLLPFPALDGGRLVFLLIEGLRGKPIAKEKEAVVHFVGMALLMLLMVFVVFNDIKNIVR